KNRNIGINVYLNDVAWDSGTSRISSGLTHNCGIGTGTRRCASGLPCNYVCDGYTLAAITHPAQTIGVSDGGWYVKDSDTKSSSYCDDPSYTGTKPVYCGASPWLATTENSQSGGEWGPASVHNATENVGFLDGHVKAMHPQQHFNLWNGIWYRADRDEVRPEDPPFPR